MVLRLADSGTSLLVAPTVKCGVMAAGLCVQRCAVTPIVSDSGWGILVQYGALYFVFIFIYIVGLLRRQSTWCVIKEMVELFLTKLDFSNSFSHFY